jgi:uncharacterized protein
MKLNFKFILSFLLVTVAIAAYSQQIPPRPNPPKLVNDEAGVLSADEESRLEQQLVAYDDSTSNQVAIVLINTLDNYPIEEYATRLFREWGIGNKKTNNGVLIIAAIEDRKIRIEVGYGLEGAIPDITSNHIIEDDIKPNFRSNDYYEGLSKAANSIIRAAAGEYSAPKGYRNRDGGGGGAKIGFIVFVIVMVILFAGRGRGGGGGGGFMSRRGSGWLGPLILGNILGRMGGGGGGGGWGSSGGGGWSGGGGGFGGFGGGSSGGGGASGSW